MKTPRFTVFTPAYNRAGLIGRLYESLCRQSFRDFEWLVVDDGSTDGTEALFSELCCRKQDFSIRYIRQENGGKHRAVNRGVREAAGELFFIVDSDDYLTEKALEAADRMEKTLTDRTGFAGVCGRKGFDETTPIGSGISGTFLDATAREREANGILGDQAEIFYTEILREYPFPEFPGEKFLTEAVVWDRIGQDGYRLRYFNEILAVCNYLDSGLTANMAGLYIRNPRGYALYLTQCSWFGTLTGREKWQRYLEFFYAERDTLSFREISRLLEQNPAGLWLRFLGLRLRGKLLDGKQTEKETL